MQPDLAAEVFLNWLASAAAAVYLLFILTRPTRSLLESRMIILLVVITVLFLARGFWWWSEHQAAVSAANLMISCFPLALVVFTEGLLRRHAPFFLKLLVAIGTVFFISVSLFGKFHPVITYALLGYQIAVLLGIFLMIVGRDRHSQAESENHLISILGVTTLISIPLIVTDFQTILDAPTLRLGSMSTFIFIHAFSRQSSNRNEVGSFCMGLVFIVFVGSIIGLMFVVLANISDPYAVQACFALGIGVVFFLGIVNRVLLLKRDRRSRSFQNWLAKADTDSISSFVRSLSKYDPLQDATFIADDEMRRYDIGGLQALFNSYGTVLSGQSLQRALKDKENMEIQYAAEQISDLLKRNNSNRFCLLGRRPLSALVVNFPDVSSAVNRDGELVIINKIAMALSNDEA